MTGTRKKRIEPRIFTDRSIVESERLVSRPPNLSDPACREISEVNPSQIRVIRVLSSHFSRLCLSVETSDERAMTGSRKARIPPSGRTDPHGSDISSVFVLAALYACLSCEGASGMVYWSSPSRTMGPRYFSWRYFCCRLSSFASSAPPKGRSLQRSSIALRTFSGLSLPDPRELRIAEMSEEDSPDGASPPPFLASSPPFWAGYLP